MDKQAFGHTFRKKRWSSLFGHPGEEKQFQRAVASITQDEQVMIPQMDDC
jgi:hypothetical protein